MLKQCINMIGAFIILCGMWLLPSPHSLLHSKDLRLLHRLVSTTCITVEGGGGGGVGKRGLQNGAVVGQFICLFNHMQLLLEIKLVLLHYGATMHCATLLLFYEYTINLHKGKNIGQPSRRCY